MVYSRGPSTDGRHPDILAAVNDVDWTGVGTSQHRVAPLCAQTFVERLRLLSVRARDLQLLRQAVAHSHEKK